MITGRMPADFLDDVMSVNVEQISQAYAAALNEGKEKKAAKIIWKRIEFPAEIACESAGISKSAAWNGSRALKDSILASCQAS